MTIVLKELGISEESVCALISAMKKLPGASNYDGTASSQVAFQLADGQLLRIGIADDDIADVPGGWVDVFEGLGRCGCGKTL